MGNEKIVERLKKSADEGNGCQGWNAWWLDELVRLNGRERINELLLDEQAGVYRDNINWDKVQELVAGKAIKIPGVDVSDENLTSLNLEGVIMVGAKAEYTMFGKLDRAICIGMRGQGSILRRLWETNLKSSDLTEADVRDNIGAMMEGAQMERIDVSWATQIPSNLPPSAKLPHRMQSMLKEESPGWGSRDEMFIVR